MLPRHERMLPMNLQLTGRWKDLRETTSWQPMCTCPLVGSPWLLNVLSPPVIWRKECQGRKPHQTFLAMIVRGEKGLVRLWDLACYWSACQNEGTHESSIDLASFCLGVA